MLTEKKRKKITELLKKSRTRKEMGLYIVEGPRSCEELLPTEIEEVYVTEQFLNLPAALKCKALFQFKKPELVTEAEMKSISDTSSPQGILAIVRMPENKGAAELIRKADGQQPFLLILETIQDPGNLGTMMRTAEAAGVTGILMNEATVDPYSPKVVRSSMSSIFRIPFAVVADLQETVSQLRRGCFTGGMPVTVLAASPAASQDYCSTDYTAACAVMIGNEAAGLSKEMMQQADRLITIPMKGRIESLNAAMAATVIAFEAARQRRLS